MLSIEFYTIETITILSIEFYTTETITILSIEFYTIETITTILTLEFYRVSQSEMRSALILFITIQNVMKAEKSQVHDQQENIKTKQE